MANLNKNLLPGFKASSVPQTSGARVTEKSSEGIFYAEQIKQQCALNKNINNLLNSLNAFTCDDAKVCINAELALPNAGVLSNFGPAVITAYETHIAAGGADPEFCGEMLACLQSATPAVVDAVAAILNTALATSPNPILSNLCSYINDCIDSGFLAVSADASNLITTGTDGGALLTQATINAGTTNVLTSTVNTITSTVNGQVATAPIIDTVVTTTDVNGDLVITINGVASAPIDINPDCADVVTCVESEPSLTLQDVTVNDLTITGDLVIPASELSLTTAVNTATLLVGNQTVTAPIINSNVQSLVGTTLTSTVNGIAAPVDLAPLMNSAVFQSDDDQVLTAGATSDMDVQLVPTTIVDPDSQVNKINYEISVTPKPTVICSGNPLSATNKLLTSDTLTNNVTLPTTVVAAPDPTYSCNSYTLATKVLNGCNEDIYVPVGKTTSLRTLLPSLIVTANPLIPDFNDAGKDYYVTSISYIDNTILSFCPTFYEIRSRGKIYISQPNNDGAVYSSLSGPGAIWYDETVDNYSKDQSYVYVSVPTTTMYQNIFGSINAFHSIRVIVDVGISPVMAGGGFSLDMSQAAMVLMYP